MATASQFDATRCRDLARLALARIAKQVPVTAPEVQAPPVTPPAPTVPAVSAFPTVAPHPRSRKSPPMRVTLSPMDAMHRFRVVEDGSELVCGVFHGRGGVLDAQDLAKKLARRGGSMFRVEKRDVDEETGKFRRDEDGKPIWIVMSRNALPGVSVRAASKPWVEWGSKRGRPATPPEQSEPADEPVDENDNVEG